MYAMGITDISNILMVLGISSKMTETEKEVTTSLMIQGFEDAATEAETKVTGGQTVYNPWPMIGGTAMGALEENEFIRANGGQDGDVLVLTKPIGTQLVVNAYEWLTIKTNLYQKI